MGHHVTKIRTNTIKDSVCDVKHVPIKFATLWANYPDDKPYIDPKTGNPPKNYEDQCAIKVCVALHKSGVEMKSFRGESRILVNGKSTAAQAEDLASWLKLIPFCGLPSKTETVTGKDWEKKISGRTGIVFFKNYWQRSTDSSNHLTGDHIDLWNGSRLTATGWSAISTIGRRIGVNELFPGTSRGYSDLRLSSEILFWEVK